MTSPMVAAEVLDREFLELRAKILELAASFDRLDRSDGSIQDDPRWKLVQEALTILQTDSSDRAEQVQLLCSRGYKDDWRESFGM